MYLITNETTNNLNHIIMYLKRLENENEKIEFLKEYVEDPASLLAVLNEYTEEPSLLAEEIKSIHNKTSKKIKQEKKKNIQQPTGSDYSESEIYTIFSQKSDTVILKEYTLESLKKMYVSIYKKSPSSRFTKRNLVQTMRNRFFTINRAEAFACSANRNN